MATNMSEALDVVGPENLRLACQQMAETIPAPVSQFLAQPLKLLDREPECIADVFRMGVTIPQQALRGDIHEVLDAVDQVDQLLRVRQRAGPVHGIARR